MAAGFESEFCHNSNTQNERNIDTINTKNVASIKCYKFEQLRLNTFNTWPLTSPVNPSRLAKSGFYYSGNYDIVTCFSCSGCIGNWQYGDIVQKKHSELFPHCCFISGNSNNIPLIRRKRTVISKNVSLQIEKTLTMEKKCSSLCNVTKNSNGNCNSDLQCKLHTEPNSHSECDFLPTDSRDLQLTILKHTPDFEALACEKKRLKTFEDAWPLQSPNMYTLSKAGFFYLGHEDKVQCAFCKGIVSCWGNNDSPMIEHLHHFPQCVFVLQHILTHPDFILSDKDPNSYDPNKSPSFTDDNISTHKADNLELPNPYNLSIKVYSGPAHPQQSSLEARLRSFTAWPVSSPVKKDELAAAGFFYIGISDNTKCFYCDGGLCCWEPGDEPWKEHARWFKNCTFVLLTKGNEFVQSCISSPHLSSVKYIKSTQGDDLIHKVDEYMNSSLIFAVKQKNLFPHYLIRAAVLKQLQNNKEQFTSIEEACEAILAFKQHIQSDCLQLKEMDLQNSDSFHSLGSNLISCDNVISTTDCDWKTNLSLQYKRKYNEHTKLPLEEENQLLKDQRLCKICMDSDVEVVFLPCGHLLVCTACAPAVNDCPLCRTHIQAIVRVYIS